MITSDNVVDLLSQALSTVCMICGDPAIFYLDCPKEEGGCGEWSWCSEECELEVAIRFKVSGLLYDHIDHDGCDAECCANRHVMLSYRTICKRQRQLTFSDHILFTLSGGWIELVSEWAI